MLVVGTSHALAEDLAAGGIRKHGVVENPAHLLPEKDVLTSPPCLSGPKGGQAKELRKSNQPGVPGDNQDNIADSVEDTITLAAVTNREHPSCAKGCSRQRTRGGESSKE